MKNYGHSAPFTLAILERLAAGGYLLPGEWARVVQSVLGRGEFLSWKAEFLDRGDTLAARNRSRPSTGHWTADKICDQGKFASELKQRTLSRGILSQTAEAALGAWRAIPTKGSITTPLSKIVQNPQESFSQFVARLQEAAERILGPEDTESKIVKQLAYENANAACRAVLKRRTKSLDLHGMIRLCNDADLFTHQMSKAVSLAIGATIQAPGISGSGSGSAAGQQCFKCGQPGHFARQCPSGCPSPQNGGPSARPTFRVHIAGRVDIGQTSVAHK